MIGMYLNVPIEISSTSRQYQASSGSFDCPEVGVGLTTSMKFLFSLYYFILPSTPHAIENSLFQAIVGAGEKAVILPAGQPWPGWPKDGGRGEKEQGGCA